MVVDLRGGRLGAGGRRRHRRARRAHGQARPDPAYRVRGRPDRAGRRRGARDHVGDRRGGPRHPAPGQSRRADHDLGRCRFRDVRSDPGRGVCRGRRWNGCGARRRVLRRRCDRIHDPDRRARVLPALHLSDRARPHAALGQGRPDHLGDRHGHGCTAGPPAWRCPSHPRDPQSDRVRTRSAGRLRRTCRRRRRRRIVRGLRALGDPVGGVALSHGRPDRTPAAPVVHPRQRHHGRLERDHEPPGGRHGRAARRDARGRLRRGWNDHPDRHRDRDPALPPLRDRPDHQPDDRLRSSPSCCSGSSPS